MKIERRQVWWSLWLQWVAATVGALALAAEVVRRLLPAIFGLHVATVVVTGLAVMSLVGMAQGLILRRYGVSLRTWTLATLAGSVLIIALAALAPLVSQPSRVIYHRADGSVQIWTREEIAPGRVGTLIASADGALAYRMTAVAYRMHVDGSVAVGSLGSGVYVGDFNAMLGFPIMWLLGGVSIGIAQWLVLRRRITRAGGWLPATILGRVAAGISASIVLGLMRNLVTSLEVPLMVSIAGMGVYSAVPGAVTGMVLVWGTRRYPALKEGTP